jgi:eukaryotic-like serine/threonine-protein kinase
VSDAGPRSRRSLGKYRFVATLGHGGMAEVFLAVAKGPAGFNKLVVIKRLRPNLAEDAELCAMFLDEARLAARLNHKNVVQTNEVDRIDGHYFMAMEYLDGQPLHRVLGRVKQAGKTLPLPLVRRIVGEVLAGLHYAHELSDYDGSPLDIVHRDVSPQNVFVTYDGQVKIVDFGIAKAARRVVETDTGVIKGKLSYMAPEQAFSPSAEIDRRADVFSVGVMLWEMLAGKRLWQDMGDPEIMVALMREAPHVAKASPGADLALARIAERALGRDRGDRHATAAAMRADVEQSGEIASAEQLGAFVERLFHEQRVEIKARIARQIDLLDESEDGAALLDLERGSAQRRSLASIPPREGPPREGAGVLDLESGSHRAPGQGDTPTPSTVTARQKTERTPDGISNEALFSHHDRPPSRAPLVLGATLAVAVMGAIYLTSSSGRETPKPAASAAASHAPTAAPSASVTATASAPHAPLGAYIHVHLAANPVEARVLVDGAVLPTNPFDGKFVKDGAAHRVQFEAGGFLSQSRVVIFDKDVSIDVPLKPRPKAAEAPGMKPDPYT